MRQRYKKKTIFDSYYNTMTMRRLFALTAILVPLVSCTRENPEPGPETDSGLITLNAGFETQAPAGQATDTKTYVANKTEIRWSTADVDKRIYVFDSEGGKNSFTSSSETAEAVRSFSGSITAGSRIKYVLWHGYSDNSVLTESSGNTGEDRIWEAAQATKSSVLAPERHIFSGSCLTLPTTQTITIYNSFTAKDNFAVMKEGDDCLKSVFGYLRYRIPVGSDGYGTIKSITVTADEDLAGQVEIDYTGDDPVATIVSGGSNSVTVKTRWQTGSTPYHYEPDIDYMILPAGTYHNVSVTIRAINGSGSGSSESAVATFDPFTIYCRGEVKVERGKYTDLGTLPLEKPAATNPGFKFDTDYFESFTDPVSGVVSYRIKSTALGWDNSQSPYYNCPSMTDDERFIFFFVSANEWQGGYHSLQRYERSAKILDLETRKLYTFYATDGCYPYLDRVNDQLYYCITNTDRTSATFYRRDLLVDPGLEIALADFPQEIIPEGTHTPIRRVCSHITLTQDKTKVFLDSRVEDSFYQGLLDLYTGEWTEWSHNVNQLNLTHGQLNPTRDDEALLAVDSWDDKSGVHHSIIKDPDGEFGGVGTYPRIQVMKSDGSRRTIRPSDPWNYATHEAWHRDGEHIFWCSGMRFDKTTGEPVTSGGVSTGGFHIRSVRDESDYHYYKVARSTHCFLSRDWFTDPDRMFAVHDDDRPYGEYTTGYYRGGPWRVWFYNAKTQKDIAIYSALKPIALDPEKPSRLHPDPHPHFVAGDKYVVCTAYGDDGNMHFSITPVDQLISKSLE